MLADERARIAAPPRETPAKGRRQDGTASGQQQQEIHGRQKEWGTSLSPKDLEQRNDQQHGDGKVHGEGMEAPDKLQQRCALDSVRRSKQQERRQEQQEQNKDACYAKPLWERAERAGHRITAQVRAEPAHRIMPGLPQPLEPV